MQIFINNQDLDATTINQRLLIRKANTDTAIQYLLSNKVNLDKSGNSIFVLDFAQTIRSSQYFKTTQAKTFIYQPKALNEIILALAEIKEYQQNNKNQQINIILNDLHTIDFLDQSLVNLISIDKVLSQLKFSNFNTYVIHNNQVINNINIWEEWSNNIIASSSSKNDEVSASSNNVYTQNDFNATTSPNESSNNSHNSTSESDNSVILYNQFVTDLNNTHDKESLLAIRQRIQASGLDLSDKQKSELSNIYREQLTKIKSNNNK